MPLIRRGSSFYFFAALISPAFGFNALLAIRALIQNGCKQDLCVPSLFSVLIVGKGSLLRSVILLLTTVVPQIKG